MNTGLLIGIVLAIGVIAYLLGRKRAVASVKGIYKDLHSLPSYHGLYSFIWATVPALALLTIWTVAQPFYVDEVAKKHFPPEVLEDSSLTGLRLNTVDQVATGYARIPKEKRDSLVYGTSDLRSTLADEGVALPGDVPRYVLIAAREIADLRDTLAPFRIGAVIALSVLGLIVGYMAIAPKLRTRNLTEGFIRIILIAGSAIAILTTFGIVMSMVFETIHFFNMVPPQDFFFSMVWDPGFSSAGAVGGEATGFGLIPLLWGTAYVSFIALLIAVPIGLYAAVYMSEFASKPVRSFAKPVLEVLAGIPTIVYGFFALVTVGPFIRDTVNLIPGMSISASSVATAGVVMGIMIIPFVSSLSDDIINAVPQSLRDGSLGLGATKAETVRLVVLPAALPGIVGAVLLAASRAIGETMIVVLAAGATANLSVNPFEAMTTVTVKIVTQLTGDVEFTSPQALVAFALGLTLFVVTLGMNIMALRIVRKYREQYE